VAGGGRRNAKGASGGGWWRGKQVVVKDESITVQKVTFNHNPQLTTHLSNFPTSPPRVPHFFEHLAQMPRAACISMLQHSSSSQRCLHSGLGD